jgi:carboxyl-terminal processing protease
MDRQLGCKALCVMVLWYGGVAAADAEPAQDGSFAARVLAITDVVLQQHIASPARQEMILAGVRALYRAGNRAVPKGLSGRISQLSSPEDFTAYLQGVRTEFHSLENAEAVMTRGMFEAIPGGAVLVEAEDDRVQEQLRANRYVGIGIVLGTYGQQRIPQIMKPIFNGPAWNAGVKAEDLVLEINGESTASKDLSRIVQEFRGEEGTQLTVVVRQPDSQESRRLTVTRSRVFIPTVEGFREKPEGGLQFTTDSAPDMAVLRIKNVGPSTLHELRLAEAMLRRENVRGIILDLREGGGVLHDLVLVADSLLDGGIIGHVQTLDGLQTYEARPGAMFHGLPMVVLITKFANADRVFLAAALQDHGRAVVIGEPTSGETYVRSIVPIPGRREKITLATGVMQRGDGTLLLAPRRSESPIASVAHESASGQAPTRPGFIVPNHAVKSDHRAAEENDPLVAKAIEVLRSLAATPPNSVGGSDSGSG